MISHSGLSAFDCCVWLSFNSGVPLLLLIAIYFCSQGARAVCQLLIAVMVGYHDGTTPSEDERAQKYWDDLDKELLGPDHARINAIYLSLVRKDSMIASHLDICCKSSSSGKTNKSNKGKKKSKKKGKKKSKKSKQEQEQEEEQEEQ